MKRTKAKRSKFKRSGMKRARRIFKFITSCALGSVVFGLMIALAYFANEGQAKTPKAKSAAVKRGR